MGFPGPEELGRGAVVAPGGASPFDGGGAPRVTVDAAVMGDEERLADTVDRLHRAWAARRRVVVELGIEQGELRAPAAEGRPPWVLGRDFTFLGERLHFLVWANNWDCRSGQPVWWWGRKAAGLGAEEGGGADVVLPNGKPAWVDGGPRARLDLPEEVVHGESVEQGRLRTARRAVPVDSGAGGGLAPDQQAAVRHRSGPARIIAPAGSGKTRTLIARLVHLIDREGVEPALVTAVAYNNRAAAEMRSRLGRRGVSVSTIHSLGWRIVREVRPDAALLEEREVRRRLSGLVWRQPRLNTDVIGPYIEALSDIRIGFRDPEAVEQEREDVPDLPRIFGNYRSVLAARDEVDHDEQVYGAVELLLADPDLRRRWQGRCRHMLVDEFQDLTPAYLLLIRLLASPSMTVFGVGDDDQTIYGYAGADPDFLLDFDRFFPGAARHSLEVNYRSPAAAVTAVSSLLGWNRRRVDKTVRAAAAPDPDGLRILEAPDSRITSGSVEAVSGWLEEGASPEDIAVLARVNSALLPMLAGLVEAGIPVRSRIASGLLSRTVMRAALAWVRLARDPGRMQRQDLLEAARRPSRGINRLSAELLAGRSRTLSAKDLTWLGRKLEDRKHRAWFGWIADIDRAAEAAEAGQSRKLLEALIDVIGLGKAAGRLDRGRTRVDRASHSDDLVALRRTADIYPELETFEMRLHALLEGAARPADDPDEEAAGVTLSTVHRVKGMEWERVVVFGVDDGLMPHALAAETDLEEERRVLHVAVTRARRRVVLAADSAGPSPFLAELRGERPRTPAVPPAPAGTRPAAMVPAEGEARPVDPELFEKLKAWRLEKARERKVPPYVVFHDRTLEAMAAAHPRNELELLDISGVGPKKLDDYGEELLELVEDHSGS